MTRTIVVLGAGLAGVPVAHYLLAQTARTVPDLRVLLVSPNDEFYWNIASPRGVIPGALSEDKYLFPILPAFAKYGSESFEFVPGRAETLKPEENTVVVALNDGTRRTLEYHTVVIATGSDTKDGLPWKNIGTSQQTRAALAALRRDIERARSIVVGGAGSTGVELAGELGHAYAKAGHKQITLVSSGALPLESRIMTATREAARAELVSLGVRVIGGGKIAGVAEAPGGGGKLLEIAKTEQPDGGGTATTTTETLEADLFIPTFGVSYNTAFAPAGLRDAAGRLHQDATLRAPGHANVFVVGDAGNLQPPQAAFVTPQVQHLVRGFARYLETGDVAAYAPDPKVLFGVSVGPGRGTGQIGSFKPFSWMIWWFKSRHLGTDYAADYASGARVLQGK